MDTWQEKMDEAEANEKFRRDTIAEIDREYGRTKERERIVAIIERTRKWHEASKYNDVESTGRVHIAITYAIEVLDSILAEIVK